MGSLFKKNQPTNPPLSLLLFPFHSLSLSLSLIKTTNNNHEFEEKQYVTWWSAPFHRISIVMNIIPQSFSYFFPWPFHHITFARFPYIHIFFLLFCFDHFVHPFSSSIRYFSNWPTTVQFWLHRCQPNQKWHCSLYRFVDLSCRSSAQSSPFCFDCFRLARTNSWRTTWQRWRLQRRKFISFTIGWAIPNKVNAGLCQWKSLGKINERRQFMFSASRCQLRNVPASVWSFSCQQSCRSSSRHYFSISGIAT